MNRCATLLVAALFAACGNGDGVSCDFEGTQGSLVITELMVQPIGEEAGREWIEVYNPTTQEVCLNGLRIEIAGIFTQQHTIGAGFDLTLPPGSYAVLGGSQVPVFYYWGESLSLSNMPATVSLALGGEVIDKVTYGTVTTPVEKGHAMALCDECRDELCNDNPKLWRPAAGEPFDERGNRGSPGAPNGLCECPLADGVKAMRPPKAGDLLITEVYANPTGKDGNKEWFEIKVVAKDAGIDLGGVGLVVQPEGQTVVKVEAPLCVIGTPGDYLVFGRAYDNQDNGGVKVDYSYGTSITLPNNLGYIGLVFEGELLAAAQWHAAADGIALQLDEATNQWCGAGLPFGDDNGSGTPGEENPGCGIVHCKKGGNMVQAEVPQPGELEITEIFPNTPGDESSLREWFEVRASGYGAVDLNGLELWTDPAADAPAAIIQPDSGQCLRLEPGGIVVLAGAKNLAVNGIPEGSVIYVYQGISMKNEGYLGLHVGNLVVDFAAWQQVSDGTALSKDQASGEWCSATDVYWVTPEGGKAYGTPGQYNPPCVFGPTCFDKGEERPANLPLPGQIVINEVFANPKGNDTPKREWLELYLTPEAQGKDLNGLKLAAKGELKGTLGEEDDKCITIDGEYLVLGTSTDPVQTGGVAVDIVLPQFSLPNTDVNVSLAQGDTLYDFIYYDDPEDAAALQLDPGSRNKDANDSPNNWCTAKTPFNAVPEFGSPGAANPPCGAEFCIDAQGNAKELAKPYPNELVITEIYANPKSTDGKKEWFEIYVLPSASIAHLNGVGIMKKAGAAPDFYFSTSQCIELVPGEHYVLCASADPALNGGVEGCVEYGSVTLKNKNDFLGLGIPGVIYDSVPDTGVAKDGVSRSLSAEHYTADGNDSGSHWCDTPANYQFKDGLGTPGKKNPDCK